MNPRVQRLAGLGLLLGLVPLVALAQTRAFYLVLPAVAAIASGWLRAPLGRWALIGGGAMLAWLGGVALTVPSWWPIVLAALAVVGSVLDAPRATRLICVGVLAAMLLLVTGVLERSGWTTELVHAERLACACFAALAVGFGLVRAAHGSSRRAAALVIGVCAAVAAARMTLVAKPSAFPWWDSVTVAADNLAELERLDNAGFRDAAFARTALAARGDADLEVLGETCRTGYRDHVLDRSWTGAVALGALLCRELRAWPETAAQRLADGATLLPAEDRGVVERIRGEVLMSAGAVPEALRAYENARKAGVTTAASNAVRALLDRGRVDEARAYVEGLPESEAARDFLALWLHEPGTDAAAWNEVLDFTHWSTPAHKGVIVRGSGRVLQVVPPNASSMGLAVVSDDIAQFRLEIPVPEGQAMPATLVLEAKANPSFRVDLTNTTGAAVSFTCGLGAAEGVTAVDIGPNCLNAWEHRLTPSAHLPGTLRSMTIVGGYFLLRGLPQ